ncbi:PP2C family protein-serine/threonine phosphatase [Marinitenerispora sediminis]|uniref:protein-serine/threonine phosphatase n=1 Tax=Marinitenerispora sediminis TaxID=1931232 RepID=A0A368T4D9_9ACTN|nr:GAF domain-containing SpoIIE family protein phosphatase [Marinitenerispora sediminis]RCV49998.1 DNA-binding protein [Marinitenerispora sediminis]RCV51302.1 DNA-binding protein [Marinitenerispora sediminis]RCV53203.1 DNA-binding protein [Marinitenerispora sediminis]
MSDEGREGTFSPGLRRAMTRLALLADVSTALSSSLNTEEVLQNLARLLVPRLADWCVVDLVEDEAWHAAFAHRDPEVTMPTGSEGRIPPPDPFSDTPLERALAGAGPVLVESFPTGQADTPLGRMQRDAQRRFGADTAIVAPLLARHRVLGALSVVRADPAHPLTAEDLDLVEDLAWRAALAVDNARLYAAQRDTAQDFQLSLLPELPHIPGLEMEARYQAAEATAEVGGDWYDAFVLPDGATAVVVGDVAGHDRAAAVQMGHLRSMLRALAWDRREPPSEIMRRLDTMLHYLSDAQTATAVFGRIEGAAAGRWRLCWSNAGHPPPLLTTADSETRFLTDGHDMLLGAVEGCGRPDARTALPEESTLLLYSDGLIERRGEPLHRGMLRLRQQAAVVAREPLPRFCDALLEGMPDTPTDDVVLLAVRPDGCPPDPVPTRA